MVRHKASVDVLSVLLKLLPLPRIHLYIHRWLCMVLICYIYVSYFADSSWHAKGNIQEGKPSDPFLELVEDNKLRTVNLMSSEEKSSYGSTGDAAAARTSLSTITVTRDLSTEYLASLITSCINNFSEVETSSLKEELLQNFSPDDASSGLGTSLYTKTSRACSTYGKLNNDISHKASLITSAEEDTTNDLSGAITNINEQDANDAKHVISVNQLLESVLDTARHVTMVSISHKLATYAELASQCKALVKGKQEKMFGQSHVLRYML